MQKLLRLLTNGFPLWVTIGGLLALYEPQWFTWFLPCIIPGLAVIMLGMGMTLEVSDFKEALRMPRAVAIGVISQFMIMPLTGWTIATLMQLPTPFAVGLILVSCCPGGTASNVVSYLARAHVALSVLMTSLSTLLAVILTPLLTQFYAGHLVEVDALGLFLNMIKIVLLPVLAGVALHHWGGRAVQAVLPVCPLIAVVAIVLICSAIIGAQSEAIRASGGKLLAAVGLLHAFAFILGYFVAKLLKLPKQARRTISIEVGMQNSGLGTALAKANFADPLTTVPCAISAVFHSIIGSLVAGVWRLQSGDVFTNESSSPGVDRLDDPNPGH
jgi:BASS family bile acid:Na+ symporter